MSDADDSNFRASPTERASERVSPLTRGLQVWIVAGFGAVALALAALWLTLDRRHRVVAESVESIVTFEGAVSSAAYEMELAIAGTGLAVNEYVATGAPNARTAFEQRGRDYEAARARFQRVATTGLQRELGDQIASLNKRHRSLGEERTGLRDRRRELATRVADDFVRLERLSVGVPGEASEVAALKLRLREFGRVLGRFLATSDDAYRTRALDDLDDLTARISALQGRESSANRALVEEAAVVIEVLTVDLREIVDVDARMRQGERELVDLRSQFDGLHRSIQAVAQQELEIASKQATLGIQPRANFMLVGGAIFVALFAGALILQRSVVVRAAAFELESETRRRRAVEQDRSQLLERLVSAHEDERARVSRELHDQMGQKLSAMVFGLDALVKRAGSTSGPSDIPQHDLEAMRDLAGELLDDAHSVAHQLRPPALTDLGLQGALTSLVERWQQFSGISIDLYNEFEDERLTPNIETTLYRVVQEALTNVRKHAGARSASVVLKKIPGFARLVIDDDGKGFDVAALADPPLANRPLGLRGIRERVELVGGTLEVESVVDRGTTLVVSIPIG